jgi:hypothetical protein
MNENRSGWASGQSQMADLSKVAVHLVLGETGERWKLLSEICELGRHGNECVGVY